jgi:hypothetical protein
MKPIATRETHLAQPRGLWIVGCSRTLGIDPKPDVRSPLLTPCTRRNPIRWPKGCRDTTKYGHRGAIRTTLGPGRIPAGITSRSALYMRSSFSLRLPQALFINASPSTRSRKLYNSHRQSSWLWVVDLRRRYIPCRRCLPLLCIVTRDRLFDDC